MASEEVVGQAAQSPPLSPATPVPSTPISQGAAAAGAAVVTANTAPGTDATIGDAVAPSNPPKGDKEVDKAAAAGRSRRKRAPRTDIVPYRKLFRFADKRDALMTSVACVLAAVNGAIFPLFTIIMGNIINSFGSNDLAKVIEEYALYFFLLGIGTFIASFCEVALAMYSAERQGQRMRLSYMKAILRQDMEWYDTNNPGEAATRMAEDTVVVLGGIGEKLTNTIHYAVTFITGLTIGFTRSYKLTFVILGFAPLLIVMVGFLKFAMARFDRTGQDAYAAAGEAAIEVFSSIRTVIAYGGQAAERRRYEERLKTAEKAGIKKGVATGIALGFMLFAMFSAYGVGLMFGSYLISWNREDKPICRVNPTLDGCLGGGDIIQNFIAVLLGTFALGQVGPNISAFGSAQAAGYKIFKTIDRVPRIDVYAPGGHNPPRADVRGRIEFRNVTFAYPTRPDELVLRNFNLIVEPGQTVALCGPSGSGKSTIVALVQRLYDPQEGHVFVDGVDVREWNLAALRSFIGLVSQEPQLFGATLRENIAMGKPDYVAGAAFTPALLAEIEAATEAANAHQFIKRLPQGYETQVGTSVSTTTLSGGQRQRCCIARALIRQPRLLLLDEATSALDTESEKVVQRALDNLLTHTTEADAASRFTCITIAHRLSTITNADRIIVLRGGAIVESGTHTQLMAMEEGVYRGLRAMQEVDRAGREEAADKPALLVHVPSASGYVDVELTPTSPTDEVIEHQTSFRARRGTAAAADIAAVALDVPPTGGSALSEAAASPKTLASSVPPSPSEVVVTTTKTRGDAASSTVKLPKVPAWRVWKLQLPHWPYIIIAALTAALSGIANPVFAILYSDIIVVFYNPDDVAMRKEVLKYMGYLLGLAGGILICKLCQQYTFAFLGEKLTTKVRSAAYANILRQDMAFFDQPEYSAGRLSTRLAADSQLVRATTGERLALTVENNAGIIGALVIAFVSSWRLALVLTAVSPLILLSGRANMKSMRGFAKDSAKSMEDAGHVASEAVMAVRTVMAFNLQPHMLQSFHNTLRAPMRAAKRGALSGGFSMGSSQFVLFSAYALAFYVGAKWIQSGVLSFSDFMRAFMAVTLTAQSVGRATSNATDQAKAERAKSELFALIDRPSAVDPDAKGGDAAAKVSGHIEFRNVSFAYPTRPHQPVLQNFSLTIEPGQTVALVGPSGSGKSTVVQLLERFYNPSSGDILIDGKSISAFNVQGLRSRMGLVQQEPTLFSDCIAYNIAYPEMVPNQGVARDVSAPQEEGVSADHEPVVLDFARHVTPELVRAAESANAASFIDGFHNKFATHCGDRGSQLSGGQRQRIVIARAVRRAPSIMLLDEATSALDAESEAVVQQALNRLLRENGDMTKILIAHRLSTVRDADKIVVIENGHIVESGRHDDLMKRPGGLYRKLAEAQDAGVEASVVSAGAASSSPTAAA